MKPYSRACLAISFSLTIRLLSFATLKFHYMKHKLTIAICLLAFAGSAQYFEHRYGMPITQEHIGSGQFTDLTGKGHIMSGQRMTTASPNELLLIRTEQNGRIVPGPYFKNRYALYDASISIQHRVLSSRVAELNDYNFYGTNGVYGVVGVCETDPSTSQQAVYYALFDANGTPLLARTYNTNSGAQSFVVNAIRASDDLDNVYLCGMVFDGIQHYAMVMKLEIITGNIVWARTYEVDSGTNSGEPEQAFDLIENQATGELLVVGQRHVCLSTSDDGYIMHLDPATGLPGPLTDFYGNSSDPDSFQSIDRAAAQDGFYVCGWSGQTTTTRDHWVLKFDNTSDPPLWSTLIDYFQPSTSGWGADNPGIDLIERVNTSGIPEIYSMGRTAVGELGGTDIEIYKVDAGLGVVLDQYTHGNFKNDYPANIHMHNTGAVEDGLGVYSMREHNSSNFDLMMHKSYFNGISPTTTGSQCDYDIVQRGENQGPNWLYEIKSYNIDEFYMIQNELRYIDTLRDLENCHEISITGGSNALMLNNEMGSSANIQLAQTVENNAILTVEAEIDQAFSTDLRDAGGSIIHSFGTTTVFAGKNEIALDFAGLSLATGVYFIVWSNGIETGTEKLVIR